MIGALLVRLVSVAALVVLPVGGCATTTSRAPARDTLAGPSREVLANGLRVIIQEYPASDVVAISTYLTISLVFWYLGMIPDLATLRSATWLDKSALVICDVVDEKTDHPVGVAPRSMLATQVEAAAAPSTFTPSSAHKSYRESR
jgi:voltage-gated potassium channel Kch